MLIKMLINVNNSCDFYRDKGMNFFCISKRFLNIAGKGPFMIECELCVYGQGEGETEMITRVLLRTQLGASLN